jgi:hypothetical protein
LQPELGGDTDRVTVEQERAEHRLLGLQVVRGDATGGTPRTVVHTPASGPR